MTEEFYTGQKNGTSGGILGSSTNKHLVILVKSFLSRLAGYSLIL